MIHNDITIMFAHEGVTCSLMVNGGSGNLPYDLATAICEVVKKTCANPEMPSAKSDAQPGGDKVGKVGQQLPGERVYESDGLALAIHNAEDVATMRDVILHIYGYIVNGLPLPPLSVDSFHDGTINSLVTSIYEHAIEEGRTIPLRKDSGSMNEYSQTEME